MVESPRIRILYDNIRFTKNKKIMKASGASYNKIGIDLTGFVIRKWWFVGKYIFCYLVNEKRKQHYVIRTHMMMYGKITINNQPPINPRLRPFLVLELDDTTILSWYLTQIKILDPTCKTDMIKSNYQYCSSKKTIMDSMELMKYDISHPKFNMEQYRRHLDTGVKRFANDILVDFLLNQEYFPGVGNILQQEALYRCKLNPLKTVNQLAVNQLLCLVDKLKEVINQLYQS